MIMVHAKASDGSSVSAGALHEVCSQAAKQIGTIGQFNPVEPKQVGLWGGAWKGPGGEGTVDARLRRCRAGWAGLDGPGIWSRLRALLLSQSTEREVVMVLGAALDRDRLFEQARKAKPPAPAIHCIQPLAVDHGRGGRRECQIDGAVRVRSIRKAPPVSARFARIDYRVALPRPNAACFALPHNAGPGRSPPRIPTVTFGVTGELPPHRLQTYVGPKRSRLCGFTGDLKRRRAGIHAFLPRRASRGAMNGRRGVASLANE